MSRRMRKSPFPAQPGDPAPLTASMERIVRFEEIDPMGIAWHGRYPSYLEDGRTIFGETYGFSYRQMRDHGFYAPVVTMNVDYHRPMTFGEPITIETRLHWTQAARLNFTYVLSDPAGQVRSTAHTVQMFTSLEGEPLILRPAFVEEFFSRWEELRNQ